MSILIKIKDVLLKGSVVFLVPGVLLFVVVINIKKNNSVKNPPVQLAQNDDGCIDKMERVDIVNIPFDNLVLNDNSLCYEYNEKKVGFNGNPIVQIFFSPSKEKIGFMEDRDIFDENIPEDEQKILYVGDAKKKDFKEIFHGSFRTSGWEWFSENEVLVHYNCGTECQALYLANVDSGKETALVYGVNYEWSPNKEFVLAYHYSWKYGITAGDKNGKVLLEITRGNTSDKDDELIQKTKAIWSPDSSRLALVIKKEYIYKMEVLVFDVKNNFNQIYRQDMPDVDEYNLRWSDDSKRLILNEKEIKVF